MAQAVSTLGGMVGQVYHGRKPKASPLWQCLSHHFDEFLLDPWLDDPFPHYDTEPVMAFSAT